MKSYFNIIFFNRSFSYKTRIIGILLILLGIIFFFNSFWRNLKVGLLFILIGILMLLIMPKKETQNNIIDIQIFLVIIIWLLFMFCITINLDSEIFFVLLLLGILIIEEFTDKLISVSFKKRLSIIIFLFLIIFITIVTKRIINI